jgi:hypothetical protein
MSQEDLCSIKQFLLVMFYLSGTLDYPFLINIQ